MRQENNKWQKRADRGGFGVPNEYDHYVVSKPAPLLEWLLENVKSSSKTKIKQILQGRGIRVDGTGDDLWNPIINSEEKE